MSKKRNVKLITPEEMVEEANKGIFGGEMEKLNEVVETAEEEVKESKLKQFWNNNKVKIIVGAGAVCTVGAIGLVLKNNIGKKDEFELLEYDSTPTMDFEVIEEPEEFSEEA